MFFVKRLEFHHFFCYYNYETVQQPIFFFLFRTREDTVRCIVTSLTDENSTELAEVETSLLLIVTFSKVSFRTAVVDA